MIQRVLLVAAGTIVLTVLQASLAFLAPVSSPPAPGAFGLVLASNALTAALLAEIARRLPDGRLQRAGILWLLWGGIQVNSLSEALLFDIGIPRGHVAWLVAWSLAVSGGFAAFMGAAAGTGDRLPSEHRVRLRMLALCPPLYLALYFVAGMLVWPYVRDFYLDRPMPALPAVASVQVIRGLGFGLTVLLLVRTLRATRSESAVLAGLALSVLGGVAPLLLPNPYLPAPVRLAHLPEVGVSNLLFGVIVAWALSARPRALRSAVTA